jgi:3-deoxy-D-manno-octulosonic-acid transferase
VAVVLVEAEIWPNFLWRVHALDIPLFLANARLSERSYRGYKRCGFLFRPLFAGFTGVGCQNEADAARLREIGCRPEAIRVIGNLKYDAAQLDERRALDVPSLLRQLGIKAGAKIVVGGSTHAGEEGLIAGVCKKLRIRFPDLFLVLVPRHFERAQDAMREVAAQRLKAVFRTEITSQTQYREDDVECLVVNTTGELRYFYEFADVVFVGKSLLAEGGQNPIEPGALGKPIVFGPNMQNFAAIAAALVQRQGAAVAHDAAELEHILAHLLDNETRRQEMGRQALAVVQENLGAVERTVEMIIERLRQKDIYVAEKGAHS